MTGFAERFRQEGLQQGMQQGEVRLLERQLRLKFGDLPATVRERIAQADEATLLEWSDRVLTAASLEEVLR